MAYERDLYSAYDDDVSRYRRGNYRRPSDDAAVPKRQDARQAQSAGSSEHRRQASPPRQQASQPRRQAESRRSVSPQETARYRDRTRYTRSSSLDEPRASRHRPSGRGDLSGTSSAASPFSRAAAAASRATSAASTRKAVRRSSDLFDGPAVSPLRRFAVPIVALALVIAAIGLYLFLRPIDITLNGKAYTVGDSKDVAAAVRMAQANGLQVEPGDFVAVDGSLITRGKGNAYDAAINEKPVQPTTKLHNGDKLLVSDGSDIMEDFTSTESAAPATFSFEGVGAIHLMEGTGESGVLSTRTGAVSGKTATEYVTAPGNRVLRFYNAETNGEKVVALTFDDGPSDYTQELLDILKQYNAKATFFVVGENVDTDWGTKLVKAEAEAGHQVCTHTYTHCATDRADGKSGSLGYLTEAQQRSEITQGIEAIRKAIGGGEVSTIFRAPSGYIDEDIMSNLQEFVTGEMGWNVDTMDWSMPGSDAIYSAMMGAQPGEVILCHDGGGDRSQTVAAVRRGVADLTAQGYRFVTVDELIAIDKAARGM